MITAIVSILILTFIVWVINKVLPLKICPICAGVSLTWLWMFFGMFSGKLSSVDYQLPTAILAGGTVVGLMSVLEKFIEPKFVLIWKTVFVACGFAAVYGLVADQFVILFVGVVVATAATFAFKTGKLEPANGESKRIKRINEEMEKCC